MIRQEFNRIDPKRRHLLDHRKKQFAEASYKDAQYPHRLNFYSTPPTADIKLEEFEQWAIDRLRILAELEACAFRNRSLAETTAHMRPLLERYLPLDSNSSASSALHQQRKKDHYSHFILRLAFAATEDLRRRFCRVETQLFRLRMLTDDARERAAFFASLDLGDSQGGGLGLEPVSEEEWRELAPQLAAVQDAYGGTKGGIAKTASADDASSGDGWFKVDWTRVPDLVEQRRVFLRAGKAYVPAREQPAMICAEFADRLERAMLVTARALPRLDEDDRLSPILAHLGKNFVTPDSAYSGGASGDAAVPGSELTARNVDNLAANHFPLCMQNLHRSLRRDAHLKHFGRLQYTLFLKGIGLSLEECLVFWRSAFSRMTDDTFNKEYRYNVRHAYGDVGGDGNRRGGGYSPFSCQKILTDHPPGPGEAHGCPYRHFSVENLTGLLQAVGITDRAVLQDVVEDKEKQKYHMACNRVFEHVHKAELKRAKDEGVMSAAQLETIVHPNEYFKRSYLLKNMGKVASAGAAGTSSASGASEDVKMEGL